MGELIEIKFKRPVQNLHELFTTVPNAWRDSIYNELTRAFGWSKHQLRNRIYGKTPLKRYQKEKINQILKPYGATYDIKK